MPMPTARRLLILTLVTCAFVSSSCGTIQQKMAERRYEALVAEQQQLVQSTKELDPIRNKVWMGPFKDEPPLQMLSLTEKPITAEREAIAKWHEIVSFLKNKLFDFNNSYFSREAATRVDVLYANRLFLILDLYNQAMSYGEYNRKTRELFVKDQQEELGKV